MPNHQSLLIALLLAALTSVTFGLPGTVLAQTTITIDVLDGPGEGFNDPGLPDAASAAGGNGGTTIGAQRWIAFAHAANIWAGLLFSNVGIVVGAQFDPLSCAATTASLGAAGTNTVHRDFPGAHVSNTWYPAALANAIAGVDLNPATLDPATNDINATFNSAIDDTSCAFPKVWYYGLDGNPPANTLDFISIVLHELAHGLGFQTFVDLSTGEKLSAPPGNVPFDDVFMLWLEDHSTGDLFPAMTDAERVSASINTGNLHWVGPNGIAQSGGLTAGRDPSGHVEMHAPNPLVSGSSVSHFSTALSPDEMMEPAFTGVSHDVGLALAVMRDIGWFSNSPADTSTGSAVVGGDGGGGCFITALSNGMWPGDHPQ